MLVDHRVASIVCLAVQVLKRVRVRLDSAVWMGGGAGGEVGRCATGQVLAVEEQAEDRREFSTCIWEPRTFPLRPLFSHLYVASGVDDGGV